METKVISEYLIQEKIGSGSFGEIFFATHKTTHEEVAIKIATKDARQLQNEARVYKLLQSYPNIKWFGTYQNNPVMIMDLLGPSLESLFCHCKKQFSLKTVLMLAYQILNQIERIHMFHIIHRDIKPDNFLMGSGKHVNNVYIIDFGLCKKYIDTHTKRHIPFREGKSMVGTVRYVSINTHKGIEQGRRDDLESIGYMLIYFLKGKLPWQGIKCTGTADKYEKIKQLKMSISIEELCKDIPKEFVQYMKYVRNLKFDEKPDYRYLQKLFMSCFDKHSLKKDYNYDWTIQSL